MVISSLGPRMVQWLVGEFGKGKMSSPRQILSFLERYFKNKDYLKKEKLKQ